MKILFLGNAGAKIDGHVALPRSEQALTRDQSISRDVRGVFREAQRVGSDMTASGLGAHGIFVREADDIGRATSRGSAYPARELDGPARRGLMKRAARLAGQRDDLVRFFEEYQNDEINVAAAREAYALGDTAGYYPLCVFFDAFEITADDRTKIIDAFGRVPGTDGRSYKPNGLLITYLTISFAEHPKLRAQLTPLLIRFASTLERARSRGDTPPATEILERTIREFALPRRPEVASPKIRVDGNVTHVRFGIQNPDNNAT